MKQHEHYGHRGRLRERVKLEGIDNFQDYQVLEYALSFVIPYKDTNPIAHNLISKFGSLGGVLEADEEDIKDVEGLGDVSAQFLTSIIKIYNFYEKEKAKRVQELKSPKDGYDLLTNVFKGKQLEEMYLICLTPKSKIVCMEKIAQGTTNETKVTMRIISDIMTRKKVSNIVIGHNHPSGEAKPSKQDDMFTKALVTLLTINDSHLIDHIIIGEKDYYSYRRSGLIESYQDEVSNLVSNRYLAQPPAEYEVDND